MARVKNFCGFELKTGGLIIGFVSFFANLLYFVTIVEAALLFVLPTSEEKKNLFGPNINALERDSIAFPIVLVAAVAALYGVISSYLLIVGVKDANRKRVLWWLIYQPIAILSVLAIAVYSIYLRATYDKSFFHCYIFEGLFLIYLLALFLYVLFNIHWFIVIVELYLEIKAAEPEPVAEEIEEVKVDKEEELQLLESPKAEEVDTTDKPEGEGEEKTAEDEKKDEAAAKPSRRIRCPELPKCPSFKPKCPSLGCPSIGNCVGPDNFQ